jgi:AraC-like DNA-binding protein
MAISCLNTRFNSDEPDQGRAYRTAFLAAGDYIDRHLGNPDLTAQTIAASLGFSRAHLYRVFASQGQTIAGVLRDRRLARARDLIASGRVGHLDALAFAVGYHSTTAFSRAFKKRFGLSPRDYRAHIASD